MGWRNECGNIKSITSVHRVRLLISGEMSVETLKDILTAGTPVYCIVAMFLYWLVIGY